MMNAVQSVRSRSSPKFREWRPPLCQLVAACDLAVAAEEAKFATPGVRIGLFCSTPMVALTRAIGRKRALEMLMTGTPIDARTAAEWGLVNHVVPAARLRDETLALAQRIIEASLSSSASANRLFYAQIDLDQDKAYDYAGGHEPEHDGG